MKYECDEKRKLMNESVVSLKKIITPHCRTDEEVIHSVPGTFEIE